MTAAPVMQPAARILMSGPLRGPSLALATLAGHRMPNSRPVRTAAYYLGEALADRAQPLRGRLASGAFIALDARDHAHRFIYFHGIWEPETTALFRRLATPGWTVLDVGANAGYFSLLAHDLGGRGSSIHAFEPNPYVAQLLEESVALVDDGAVTVVRAACGRKDERRMLRLSSDPGNTGLAAIVDSDDGSSEFVDVDVVRLDEHAARHRLRPDLIKIDVEGFELEVIEGMDGLLTEGIPAHLVCEVNNRRRNPAGLVAALEGYGYVANRIAPDGTLAPAGALGFQNLCFERPGGPGT